MTTTALIVGNTYQHKAALRAMGGSWDGEAKGWRVPANKADEARALVAGAATPAKVEKTPIGTVDARGLTYRGNGTWSRQGNQRREAAAARRLQEMES